MRRQLQSKRREGRLGVAVHRTLGACYGMAASSLVRRGVPPVVAGLAVGTAALVVVDEGTGLPQFRDYPLESHLRGVVGHETFGLAARVLLWLVNRPANSAPQRA